MVVKTDSLLPLRINGLFIPEIRLGAAQTTVTCLHGMSGALIPLQGCAGVMGGRPFTTHHEQTMARTCTSIIKAVDEQTVFKKIFPVAFLMDGLAIKHGGTQIGV